MQISPRLIPVPVLAAFACVALVGSATAPAMGQEFVYDIGIDYPEYVVLWYWDQIELDITDGAVRDYLFNPGYTGSAGTSNSVGRLRSGTFWTDAGIDDVVDDDLVGDMANVWLGVNNAWALRSVSSSGNTRVSIKIKKKDGKNGKSKIRANDAMVGALSRLGSSIVLPATGSSSEHWGEVYLQVDLSDAERSGGYEGIEVEIKAENL